MAALAGSGEPGSLVGLSPHATGTAAHRVSESAALDRAFPDPENRPALHLFKPYTGHALGASGLLDVAVLAGFLRQQTLPPNLPGLSAPSSGWKIPAAVTPIVPGQGILKIAAGMGGHNAGLFLVAGFPSQG